MMKRSIIRKFLFAMMLVVAFLPIYGKRKPWKVDNAGIEYLNTHFHLYDSLQKRIFRYACFIPGGNGYGCQQTASAGTTIGTKGCMNAAKVIFLSAYNLLTYKGLLEEVRSGFNDRRGPDFKFEPLMGTRKPPVRVRNNE